MSVPFHGCRKGNVYSHDITAGCYVSGASRMLSYCIALLEIKIFHCPLFLPLPSSLLFSTSYTYNTHIIIAEWTITTINVTIYSTLYYLCLCVSLHHRSKYFAMSNLEVS